MKNILEKIKDKCTLSGVSNSNAYIKELEKIDKIHWARIYCELNCWKMPKELIQLKPKWWKNDNVDKRKSDIIRPINNHIVLILGKRWVSREWNKERMTEEEHNRWWIDTHLT